MIVKNITSIKYFIEKFGTIDKPIDTKTVWHPTQKQIEFQTPETFVARFYDAVTHSSPPLLVTKDNHMITDHVWPLLWKTKHKPQKSHNLWSQWADTVDISLPDVEKNFNEENNYVWMPIDQESCNNPWHVWIDVISKLRLISELKQKHMFNYVYVFPCMAPYLKKVITEIFPHMKYLVMPENSTWRFRHILVPSMSNKDDGVTNPNAIQWLQKFGPQKSTPSKKIFVTRKDALTRQLVNADELMLALAGFQTIELSEYSIADQMQIFDSATHVVSTHGAGLVNLLWCQQGTKVIEINHIDQIDKKVYPILSDRCGLIHTVLYGDKVSIGHKDKPKGIKRLNDMSNIKIDVQEVLRHL
jgi:hypothetical protein